MASPETVKSAGPRNFVEIRCFPTHVEKHLVEETDVQDKNDPKKTTAVAKSVQTAAATGGQMGDALCREFGVKNVPGKTYRFTPELELVP